MAEDLVAKALSALRQKDFQTAQAAIASYAEDNVLELQHYLIKGLSELALQNWADAQDTFTEATEVFPHQAQLWLNLGAAQENLGKIDEAVDSLEHCLELHPDQPEACGNLSNLYRKQGAFEDAEAMAHRALELGASKAQSLNSLGLALGKQGKFAPATKAFNDALQSDPQNADVLLNLANLAVDQLNFNDAWTFFSRARAAKDNATARRDEGMARLLAGDYAIGWHLYEARLELPRALRITPPCPRYAGEPLAGKRLMLMAEQGFGDTIMFCRYGKLLAEQGAELIWVVPNGLHKLLSTNLPGKVFAEHVPLPEADYYLPLMSLPLVTGKLSPADMPATPYLKAPDQPLLPKAKAAKTKIGLVWLGSPTHERDHERSIPLEDFIPLFTELKNAQFYAPFTGGGLDKITDALKDQTPLIPLAKLITDFSDTAVLLQQLDYLVTVDTATAHLAGALGVQTYLLLQHSPDWRWGIIGETTSWYANMTLLRQPSYGDWGSVVEKLVANLSR
jgi:tetratricopeptide (TPR) repeat protein